MNDIVDAVRGYVEGKARERHIAETIAIDESIFRKGIIDSMGIFELATFLEDRFGLKIGDEEIVAKNFESIQSICSLVSRKLSG